LAYGISLLQTTKLVFAHKNVIKLKEKLKEKLKWKNNEK
jgi:7-keto-8-aminopelargonate synthetase-like enzyme